MKTIASPVPPLNPQLLPFIDDAWYYQSLVSPRIATLAYAPSPSLSDDDKSPVSCDESRTESLSSPSALGRSDSLKSFENNESEVVSHVYIADAAEMRRVFEKFDENGDGLICRDELQRFMSKLGVGMSDEELASTLKSVDINGDGYVDFDEFFSLYKSVIGSEKHEAEYDDEDSLLEAFSVFDKNSDGYISVLELQAVLVNLGLVEGKSLASCHRMIESVDQDGDGQIDFEEFKTMMCSKSLLQ